MLISRCVLQIYHLTLCAILSGLGVLRVSGKPTSPRNGGKKNELIPGASVLMVQGDEDTNCVSGWFICGSWYFIRRQAALNLLGAWGEWRYHHRPKMMTL